MLEGDDVPMCLGKNIEVALNTKLWQKLQAAHAAEWAKRKPSERKATAKAKRKPTEKMTAAEKAAAKKAEAEAAKVRAMPATKPPASSRATWRPRSKSPRRPTPHLTMASGGTTPSRRARGWPES